MSGADFSHARLRGSDFSETIIAEAVFRDADMRDADFRYTDTSRADCRGATTAGVIWHAPSHSSEAPEVSFGVWLKEQRESRGLDQADLARWIGLGLCHLDVNQLEHKTHCESFQLATRLAAVFNIPLADVPCVGQGRPSADNDSHRDR